MGRTLSEWLRWQETLHPRAIDLGLDRVRVVADRLRCLPATGPVFTVAGTNGKGSTVALLEAFLRRFGKKAGTYISPHLVSYNERIRIDGQAVGDAELIGAFEAVEAVRGTTPLTFFEFGTLAALHLFQTARCDALVLEVGMGGRLDAVNIVDPDFAVITTVDLDHQEYLGATVEAIAAEKAGILREARPAFFGDWPVPTAIRDRALALRIRLRCLGEHFDFNPSRPTWSWRGEKTAIEGLIWPPGTTAAQLRNISVVLAVLEQYRPGLRPDVAAINEVIHAARPDGRFQIVRRDAHEWILDVAHNPQAVATLRRQLDTLPPSPETAIVLGMLGDKSLDAFVTEFSTVARRWVVCTVADRRARSADSLASGLRDLGVGSVDTAADPDAALERALAVTGPGGRIIVCGSFRIVGPALRWLGIY